MKHLPQGGSCVDRSWKWRSHEAEVDAGSGFVSGLRVVGAVRAPAGDKDRIPKFVGWAPELLLWDQVTRYAAACDGRQQALLSHWQELERGHLSVLVAEGKPQSKHLSGGVVEPIVLVELESFLGFSDVGGEVELSYVTDGCGSVKALHSQVSANDFIEAGSLESGKHEFGKTGAIHSEHEGGIEDLRVGRGQSSVDLLPGVLTREVEGPPDVEVLRSPAGLHSLISSDAVPFYAFVKSLQPFPVEQPFDERAAVAGEAFTNTGFGRIEVHA